MLIFPYPTVDVPAFQRTLVADIEVIENEGLTAGSAIPRNPA